MLDIFSEFYSTNGEPMTTASDAMPRYAPERIDEVFTPLPQRLQQRGRIDAPRLKRAGQKPRAQIAPG